MTSYIKSLNNGIFKVNDFEVCNVYHDASTDSYSANCTLSERARESESAEYKLTKRVQFIVGATYSEDGNILIACDAGKKSKLTDQFCFPNAGVVLAHVLPLINDAIFDLLCERGDIVDADADLANATFAYLG